MYRTRDELMKIIEVFVGGYLKNHPHALFLVECDDIAVCGPTLDVAEIVDTMLTYDHVTFFCMPGNGAAKEIQFDWEHGFADGGLCYQCILASVKYCDAALEPFWQDAAR